MEKLKALVLNCTIKYRPEVSNTEALAQILIDRLKDVHQNLEVEMLRVTDYNVKFGGAINDMGHGDEWPVILKKIKACDIFIMAMPIWMGVRCSVGQMVIERLDGTTKGDGAQFPLYNTVAGVVVTGNEDGAHDVAANTLYNLAHFGCTIPPNTDVYWVGDAGPGASFIEAHGGLSPYVQRNIEMTAQNLIHGALMLKKMPYTIDIRPIMTKMKLQMHVKKRVMQEATMQLKEGLSAIK
ncbi:flavodoxin family protein [Flagellimonas algicola]|uniref:Flavodoxin family protein n=1 Tax=Flagellimonas algicola TaxID=2583815 RepID=A0ABY2WI14_9FLAO|nr:NAD(P)H-dependent oxidoreductase [Allomuricauda algicola]TMU54489.1 flavodoxin family protein [Allomuricauda algicola]